MSIAVSLDDSQLLDMLIKAMMQARNAETQCVRHMGLTRAFEIAHTQPALRFIETLISNVQSVQDLSDTTCRQPIQQIIDMLNCEYLLRHI